MKIRSKINGEISNVRTDIAREMVKLGVAEMLEPDPDLPVPGQSLQDRQRAELARRMTRPAPASPKWSVVTLRFNQDAQNPEGRDVVAIQMQRGLTQGTTVVNGQTVLSGSKATRETLHWLGDPKDANAVVKWEGGQRFLNGFGCAIPADILAEYTRLWKNKSLRLPDEVLLPPKEEGSRSTNAFFGHSWLKSEAE